MAPASLLCENMNTKLQGYYRDIVFIIYVSLMLNETNTFVFHVR